MSAYGLNNEGNTLPSGLHHDSCNFFCEQPYVLTGSYAHLSSLKVLVFEVFAFAGDHHAKFLWFAKNKCPTTLDNIGPRRHKPCSLVLPFELPKPVRHQIRQTSFQ